MDSKDKVRFYLNGKKQEIEVKPNETVLQMLHNRFALYGTKKGCEEGDCGACTVVIGKWKQETFSYDAVASCIYPAAKLDKTHLITVEGLGGPENLHIVQRELVRNNGIQCGFCTPGMVMSLFALFARTAKPSEQEISLALEGNICRCTGYEGISNAAQAVRAEVSQGTSTIVPDAFIDIEHALKNADRTNLYFIHADDGIPRTVEYHVPDSLAECTSVLRTAGQQHFTFVSGGTDIGVNVNARRNIPKAVIDLGSIDELRGIEIENDVIRVGALTSMAAVRGHEDLFSVMPIFREVADQVASQQIRNVATLAGNMANASPIGDFNALLLGLNASLVLWSLDGEREVSAQDFFVGYRQTALKSNEIIKEIRVPRSFSFVSFIKSSKRRAVDIATVNSCFAAATDGKVLNECRIAVGGVAEVPVVLNEAAADLKSSACAEIDIEALSEKAVKEISPISDVRGSAEFRRALVKNQLKKHLMRLLDRKEV